MIYKYCTEVCTLARMAYILFYCNGMPLMQEVFRTMTATLFGEPRHSSSFYCYYVVIYVHTKLLLTSIRKPVHTSLKQACFSFEQCK